MAGEEGVNLAVGVVSLAGDEGVNLAVGVVSLAGDEGVNLAVGVVFVPLGTAVEAVIDFTWVVFLELVLAEENREL